MKKILKLFFTTVVTWIAVRSQAQVSATATATARVITPIGITKNVDMSFGNVAVSHSIPGSVVMSPAGTRTTGGSGGVTLPATTGTVSPASFNVNGQASYTYAITLPGTVTISDGSGNNMTGNGFTSSPSTSGTLSASGTQTLNVGATLNVAAAQAPGVYVSATPFSVTVNYN